MSESGSDKRSRVASMIKDKGQTWDLSPNDKKALRHVWLLIEELAGEVAAYRGQDVTEAIEAAELKMEIDGHE